MLEFEQVKEFWQGGLKQKVQSEMLNAKPWPWRRAFLAVLSLWASQPTDSELYAQRCGHNLHGNQMKTHVKSRCFCQHDYFPTFHRICSHLFFLFPLSLSEHRFMVLSCQIWTQTQVTAELFQSFWPRRYHQITYCQFLSHWSYMQI